jgi:hypothetical protein
MVQQQMRYNYWTQLAILLGVVCGGIILASFVQNYFGNMALGQSNLTGMARAEAMQQALFTPENTSYAQAAQIGSTFFMFFVPSVAFILICYKKMLWAGFSKHFNITQIMLAFLIMMFANYMAGPFEDISKKLLINLPVLDTMAKEMEDLYMQAVKSMSNLKSWHHFIVAVFIVAFFPALFEELLFRGVIQNFLTKWLRQPVIAIVITSVLFSLIHLSIYLFLSRIILGLALGLIFYYTKNIWVTIIAHFINNFLALSVLFYSNLQGKAAVVNQQQFKLPVWSIFITGAILYGLFVLLIKVSAANRNRIAMKENLAFSNEPLIAQQ